jgi:hypothetical protein
MVTYYSVVDLYADPFIYFDGAAMQTTVISRIPETIDAFWVGGGYVFRAYCIDGVGWQYQKKAIVGDPYAKVIKALSRAPNCMDLFWIGYDGSVNGSFWYEGFWDMLQCAAWAKDLNASELKKDKWPNYQIAPADSSEGSAITAVSRFPGSMEVFWIGKDGSIQGASWLKERGSEEAENYKIPDWQIFQVAPAGSGFTGSEFELTSAVGSIAAISTNYESITVVWIKPDSSIQCADISWKEYNGIVDLYPNLYELAPNGSALIVEINSVPSGRATGGIAALSRIEGCIEVFWIGKDGSIEFASWQPDKTDKRWQQYQLCLMGQPIYNCGLTACSRFPNNMEVFWVGPSGRIECAAWHGKAGAKEAEKFDEWQIFNHSDLGCVKYFENIPVGITSISRLETSIDLFYLECCSSSNDNFFNFVDARMYQDYL